MKSLLKSILYLIIALTAHIIYAQKCPGIQITCNPNLKYSSLDGSCNNLRTPWFGMTKTPYKRYLRASYQDGVSTMRSLSVSGRPLTNPRVISRTLCNNNERFEFDASHLLPVFGQFIAHDTTTLAVALDSNGNPLSCSCTPSSNPDCIAVKYPANDNIVKMTCMDMSRSRSAFPTFNCQTTNQREQLNLLTSFLDGSQIYGFDKASNDLVRLFQGGLLKFSQGVSPQRPYLPLSTTDNTCGDASGTLQCFKGGEERTNENMGLLGLQTLFMREHNRIATELSRINPKWSDQILFDETRRIIIGIYQHIIYSQYLPTIIGQTLSSQAGLIPSPPFSQPTNTYDPAVDPSIANEFAAAAFRFGHSMIRNTLKRVNSNQLTIAVSVNISNAIFKTREAFNFAAGGIDSIFLGLINEPAAKYDNSVVDTLQNHLFEFTAADGSTQAFDLATLNINRGRDHGLPPYNKMRELCGLKRAMTFQDLQDTMTQERINTLSSIYENVDDIDFWVGGLSENPIKDGVVGSTFGCIIINQFRDLKRGDRFYYENGGQAGSFRPEQRDEIKKISLARLICNDFTVNDIQQNVFLLNQQRVLCQNLPNIDLNKWRE